MSAAAGNEFTAALGLRMRLARQALGITQANLAKAIGASRAHVSTIESGDRLPSLEVAAEWAVACGITLEAMFAGVTGTPPKRKRRTTEHGRKGGVQ